MSKVISLDNLQRFKNKWVDPLAERITNLEECIVGEETLTKNYLSTDTIPTSVNSYPLIESAGMDLKDIKGNSVVVNQLFTNNNFEDTSGWSYSNATLSVSDNIATLTATAQNGSISRGKAVVAGHKYLFVATIKLTTATTDIKATFGASGTFSSLATTDWQKIIVEYAASTSATYYFNLKDTRGSDWDAIQIKYIDCIDLYQWFNGSVPTDLQNDTSLFFTKYYTKNDYITYNIGSLESSQPTGLDSIGFNQWDEQWEVGGINSSGSNTPSSTVIRSKDYIEIHSSNSYYFRCPANTGGNYYFYDTNKNFISYTYIRENQVIPSIPTNACYMRFTMATAYGTTYNHDICINISNASLNGTYRPYVKHSYPLTLPILRSAGSVQDDTSKVRIGSYTFTGQENWVSYGSGYRTSVLTNQAKTVAYNVAPNMISNTGLDVISRTEVNNGTSGISCFEDNVVVSSTTGLTGKTIYYELATPTNQQAITLPENIEFEKGGTIQATYDNSNSIPADFDFEVAVYKPMQ